MATPRSVAPLVVEMHFASNTANSKAGLDSGSLYDGRLSCVRRMKILY